jgi:hypothetical protein
MLYQYPFTSCISLLVIAVLLEVKFTFIKFAASPPSTSYLHTSHNTTVICGRTIHLPIENVVLSIDELLSTTKQNGTVIIGYDDMHHVQTNNHINAFLHAFDFALDHNMQLGVIEHSWAFTALQNLFQIASQDFEQFNISTINHDVVTVLNSSYVMKSGDEMYYYHSHAPLDEIKMRRIKILRYLWTHPSLNGCSIVRELSLPAQYVVIHNRWMNHHGCLNRLGNLAFLIENRTGIKIDRRAPCLLEPSYIKSVLRIHDFLDTSIPIFVIGDGINPDIIHNLQIDLDIGNRVRTIPQQVSTVSGDMMVAALSSLFIGVPISTLSGNIARARLALGFDEGTNILFPKKRRNSSSDEWEFICQTMECLLDTTFMHNYVG